VNDLIHEIHSLIAQIPSTQFPTDPKCQMASGKLPASKNRLYLPDKELLRPKLAEWGEEVTEVEVVKDSLTAAKARQADAEEIAELARIEKQLEQKKDKR
jgi:hypothetical protein